MASDLLTKGAAWMAGKVAGSAAHDVVYTRGAASVTIKASIGRTVFRINNGDVWDRVETRDILCSTLDLGVLSLPEPGDIATETIDGVSTSYEVVSINGEPAWKWSGTTRDRVRIHTVRTT